MLVYDITNRKTFTALTQWLDELKQHAHENIVMSLVGNKSDLGSNVDTAQVVAYSEQHSMPYFSTSAKTGDNVTELFTTLVNEAHRKAVGSKVEGSGDGKTTLTIDATEGESSCCPV